ncbi:MAG: hypothetical protein DMG64_08655 [Acidobacteria bacterium]|nr:MAG: hypothetical protein DMG63_11830 [Acidobacteriota bacterium]PYY03217.1 MAG: hypothetical protein DMG64_08655 [Acidobacteriota bacterium]
MSRDQTLLALTVVGIAVGIFMLRQASGQSSAAEASAAAPTYASAPPPTPAASPLPENNASGIAFEITPRDRSADEREIINYAKSAPVSMLDSSLPHQSAGYWIPRAAGAYSRLRWEVNDCRTRRRYSDSIPLCAQANIEFTNGTRFEALVMVGSRPLDSAKPVKYVQPSLLWAFYKRPRGAVVPAPLGLLQRFGQEGN